MALRSTLNLRSMLGTGSPIGPNRRSPMNVFGRDWGAGAPAGPVMMTGINIGLPTYWTRSRPYRNALWNSSGYPWVAVSATGDWAVNRGTISGADAGDQFSLTVFSSIDEARMPLGTGVVLNPSGNELRVNVNGVWGSYSTAAEIPFTWTSGALALGARGNVVNSSGPVQIVPTAWKDGMLAGDLISPDFKTFLAAAGPRVLRYMDMLQTNSSQIEEWANRPLITDIIRSSNAMPHEFAVQMANELGIDPWPNIPPWASDDYVTNCAAFYAANMTTSRTAYVEIGNEIWGWPATPFAWNTRWYSYYDYTKHRGDRVTGTDYFTFTGHSFTTGDKVFVFRGTESWGKKEIVVVDANTIRFRTDGGGAATTANSSKCIFVLREELGADHDDSTLLSMANTNYSQRVIAVQAIFEAAMPGRYKMICGGQLGNYPVVTEPRIEYAGLTDAADYAALAPYISTATWGGRVVSATGQLTPAAWFGLPSDTSTFDVDWAIYAPGSTPTVQQMLDGTGTGYVAHGTITAAAGTSWTAASAVTGLTDGLAYEVFFLLQNRWLASGTATPGAAATTYYWESAEDHCVRLRDSIDLWVGEMETQMADIPLPVITYENGTDYNWYSGGPQEAWDRLAEMVEDPAYAFHFKELYYRMAEIGTVLACQFSDVASKYGNFDMMYDHQDLDSARFVEFASFGGAVPVVDIMDDVPTANVASDITTDPGSFPHTIFTLPAGPTYRITGGNNSEWFDLDGNVLRMVNDTGLSWTTPEVQTVHIEAKNAFVGKNLTVTFTLGDAFYSSTAIAVFDSITDIDTAAMDQIVGGQLALSGTAAAYDAVNELWEFAANGRYVNLSTGASAVASRTDPLFVAIVLDRDGMTGASGGTSVFLFGDDGSNYFVSFEITNEPRIRARWKDAGTAWSTTTPTCLNPVTNGKRVYWTYRDASGTITTGYNQTTTQTVASRAGSAGNFGRGVSCPFPSSNTSSAKHGSWQVVPNVADVTAALALVQKMMDHHGIS